MVTQKAPQLAGDHRNSVGGKAHVLREIEAVDSLDKPDDADLKQIVHALASACKLLNDGQHQPEITRYQPVPCLFVAALSCGDERADLGAFDKRQP